VKKSKFKRPPITNDAKSMPLQALVTG